MEKVSGSDKEGKGRRDLKAMSEREGESQANERHTGSGSGEEEVEERREDPRSMRFIHIIHLFALSLSSPTSFFLLLDQIMLKIDEETKKRFLIQPTVLEKKKKKNPKTTKEQAG